MNIHKKVEQIEQSMDKNRQDLEEVKAELQKPKKRWMPESGETYWFIDTCSHIRWGIWENDKTDLYRFRMRNCFKTKKKAEEVRKKAEVLADIQNYADEHNDVIEWGTDSEYKYYIKYSHESNNLYIDYTGHMQGNDTYFSSRALALQARDLFGDDYKKYVRRERACRTDGGN